MKLATLALVAYSVSGCVLLDNTYGETDGTGVDTGTGTGTGTTCIAAASSGGDGGPGGLLGVRSVESATVSGTIRAVGGAAGSAGQSKYGPSAAAGDEGEQGLTELLIVSGYQFDDSQVAAGSHMSVGVAGVGNTLTVGGSEAALTIAVERFEVGPNEQAVLGLSRVSTIIAEQFVISAGGHLVLRDRGDSAIVVGTGEALTDLGLNGGSTTILADEMVIEGTLDASGNTGQSGQVGGFGGHLIIQTRTLSVGPQGAILVDGGRGGDGADEVVCDE